MNAAKKMALLVGFLVLLGVASAFAGGCASTSSLNGKETYFIGLGRVTEGQADRRQVVGESAGVEARRPLIPASNLNASSDSLRTVWGSSEKGGN